jgi:non-ribosomal peptide synthetase component F
MATLKLFTVAAALTAVLAGCMPVPVDPALKTATASELQDRARFACVRTQARFQNVSASSVAAPCACYARRTMRALSAEEVQAFRDTAVFNDSARAKALAAIDRCGLKRPI